MSRRFVAVIAALILVAVTAIVLIAVFAKPATGVITDKQYTPADSEWEYSKKKKKWEWDTDPEECAIILKQDNGKFTSELISCSRYHQVKIGDYWNGK